MCMRTEVRSGLGFFNVSHSSTDTGLDQLFLGKFRQAVPFPTPFTGAHGDMEDLFLIFKLRVPTGVLHFVMLCYVIVFYILSSNF